MAILSFLTLFTTCHSISGYLLFCFNTPNITWFNIPSDIISPHEIWNLQHDHHMQARDTYPEYLETPSTVLAGKKLSRSILEHNINTTTLSVFNMFICLLVHTFQEKPDNYNTCRRLHFTYINQKLRWNDHAYLNQTVYTPQGLTNMVDFALLEICCVVVGILLRESELARWHYL